MLDELCPVPAFHVQGGLPSPLQSGLKAVVEPTLDADQHDFHLRDKFRKDAIDLLYLSHISLLQRRGNVAQPAGLAALSAQ